MASEWKNGKSEQCGHTLSGAKRAILTVIQPPWLVPSTKAFAIPISSITYVITKPLIPLIVCHGKEQVKAQRKCYLQIHYRRIPVRPIFRFVSPSLAVAEQFDSDDIHGICETLVCELAAVEFRGCGETVNEDEGRFGGVIGIGSLDGSGDATKVRDMNLLSFRHGG